MTERPATGPEIILLTGRYELRERLPVSRAVEAYRATSEDGREVEVTFVETTDPAAAMAGFAAIAEVRHPRLARILEWGRDKGRCVLVSERPPGRDLGLVAAGEVLPRPSDVASWGAQAAEGMAALHERGLVHGGLSPVVLVLDEDGDVTLTEAGIAAAAEPLELGDADPPQNAFYVAPEEVLTSSVTPATDVYALGATLYRLATGRPPFAGADALAVAEHHIAGAPPSPRALRPELPAALDHVILRALAKDPRRRPSASVLQRDLVRAALGARVEAPLAGAHTASPPRRPWWPWLVGLGLIALLAGALWGAGVFAAQVAVPDLTGMTVDEASATLGSVGLATGSVTYRREGHGGVVAGTVLAQSPPAGQDVTRGDNVDLVVAGDILMPDLRGMPQASAEATVRGAGLVVGEVQTQPSTTTQAGYVISQTPAPGSSLSPGMAVSITVSSGAPSPAPSPTPSGLSSSAP